MTEVYYDRDGNDFLYDDMEDMVEDMLNNGQEPITVGGLEFYAGTIAKECDPTHFRQMVLDYIDAEEKAGNLAEIPFDDEDEEEDEEE